MAGTIPLSMTQQFDIYGKPLIGGQLYIIQAGTVSTPQDAFQDAGLTIKQPYPMTLDAAGRVPQFFLADGTVKVRLQDKTGVVQLAADSVMVIGPSAGGGGGSTVDPTQLIQTGNMIFRYGFGPLTGYVRLNALTIGSATSGATERANADTQALYLYLWGIDPTLPVSGGRGATALADWSANKQLSLPDWRCYALAAMDGMGNVNTGRITPAYFGTDPAVLGAAGGGEYFTLTASHIPAVGLAVSGTTGTDSPDHVHNQLAPSGNNSTTGGGQFTIYNCGSPAVNQNTGGASARHQHPFSANVVGGGGNPHRTIGPRKLVTFYMKL